MKDFGGTSLGRSNPWNYNTFSILLLGHSGSLEGIILLCCYLCAILPLQFNLIFLKVGDHFLVLYIHQQIFVNETALNYFVCESFLRCAMTISFTSFTLFGFLMTLLYNLKVS